MGGIFSPGSSFASVQNKKGMGKRKELPCYYLVMNVVQMATLYLACWDPLGITWCTGNDRCQDRKIRKWREFQWIKPNLYSAPQVVCFQKGSRKQRWLYGHFDLWPMNKMKGGNSKSLPPSQHSLCACTNMQEGHQSPASMSANGKQNTRPRSQLCSSRKMLGRRVRWGGVRQPFPSLISLLSSSEKR